MKKLGFLLLLLSLGMVTVGCAPAEDDATPAASGAADGEAAPADEGGEMAPADETPADEAPAE